MSDINHNRMIPLHIADQAVAACEKEIATLKAEVQRLRQAGDWMREALEEGPIDYQCRIDRWNAVKEARHTK